MLEKVIDLRCPRISLETGCTIRCVLGFAKFRGVTCLVFFFCIHDQYLLLGFSIFGPRPPLSKTRGAAPGWSAEISTCA